MDKYNLLDLPILVRLTFGAVEGPDGGRQSFRLAQFRWRDEDYWVLGRMVWRNAMAAGGVIVQPVNSVRTYRVGLGIQPDFNPPTFRVGQPVMRRYPKSPDFRFRGFAPDNLVDIDFVAEEEKRLTARPSLARVDTKIDRPKPGLIV